MREITINTFCDRCAELEQREPATTVFTVGVVESARSRPQLRVVELCETHGKELQDLREFLVSRGIAPENVEPVPRAKSDAASPAGKRHGPCPACGEYRSAANTLAWHIYRDHLHIDPPSVPTVCPECSEPFGTARACGVHRSLRHQTSSATDAYAALAGPVKRPRGRPRKST